MKYSFENVPSSIMDITFTRKNYKTYLSGFRRRYVLLEGLTIFSHNFQERQVMSVLIYKRISFMSIKIWWAHPPLLGSYQPKQKRSSKQSIWSYLCEISVRQDGWHRESIVLKGSSSYFIYILLIQQQWAGITAATHWVTSSKMVQKLDSTQSHSLYFDVISV